ncbi:MAG: NifB/NifX family molybdenum-iron cluster-binding protein [Deltaproteobacteria bacterium]|nr:NifB/NifX family molybdenum-iron cluster-binding protein [Deltaproteobacteria bacterium]
MRIAIPVWEDKVSPVFDTALKLLVVEIKDQKEESRFLYHIDENDLWQKCHRIKKLELDILICGAVSHAFLQMLLASGLDVIQEISGPAEDVLKAYLQGNIFQPRFLMPGCKRGIHRCGCRAHRTKGKEYIH